MIKYMLVSLKTRKDTALELLMAVGIFTLENMLKTDLKDKDCLRELTFVMWAIGRMERCMAKVV